MIGTVLSFLKEEVNTFLSKSNSDGMPKVDINNIAKSNGEYYISNQIGLSVINIEEEKTFKSHEFEVRTFNSQDYFVKPEIKLNLYLMFYANINDNGYTGGLNMLSEVVLFFQLYNYFDSTYPRFPGSLQKLVVELYNLNFEQQNQMWASLGAKYVPSLIYKVRLITIKEDRVDQPVSPVKSIVYNIQER